MFVYRVHLEYDGTDFDGWQVQPGHRTVQAELATALARLARMPVRVEGAGRTDAGVHALGQVASFELEHEIEPGKLLVALAGMLPADLHAWRIGRASDGFSARHSALARAYCYRMQRRPRPLARRTHAVVRYPVDVQRMRAAAEVYLGPHDFSAFTPRRTASPYRVCNVSQATLAADDHVLRFDITADRFLHHMVRRLAGALVEVGRGRLGPADLGRILASGDPRRGGPCLPACGLVLVGVRYPDDPLFERTAAGAAVGPAPDAV